MSLTSRLLASTAPAPGAVEPPKPNIKPSASTRQRARVPRRPVPKPCHRDQPKSKTDDSGGNDGDGDGDDELPPHAASVAVLRKVDVCKALHISTWTLDRWLKKRLFPPPLYLTPDSNFGAWRLSTVEAFLQKRRRARRTKPKPRGMFLGRRKRARSRRAAS